MQNTIREFFMKCKVVVGPEPAPGNKYWMPCAVEGRGIVAGEKTVAIESYDGPIVKVVESEKNIQNGMLAVSILSWEGDKYLVVAKNFMDFKKIYVKQWWE